MQGDGYVHYLNRGGGFIDGISVTLFLKYICHFKYVQFVLNIPQ